MKNYCLISESDYEMINFEDFDISFDMIKQSKKKKILFNLRDLEINPQFLSYMLKIFRYSISKKIELFFISKNKDSFDMSNLVDFNRYFKIFKNVEEYNKLKIYAKFEVKIYDDNLYIKNLLKNELIKNGFGIKDRKSSNFIKKDHDSKVNSIYVVDFDSMQSEKIKEIRKIKIKNVDSVVIIISSEENINKALNINDIGVDAVIKRPFRVNDLVQKIKYLADTSELKIANKELMEEISFREQEITKVYNNLSEELKLASEIQKSFMPAKKIEFNNYLIEYLYIPSSKIGGDYCDFIPLSDHRFAVVFADISGHGIPASLLSAMLKVFIYNNASKTKNLTDLMRNLNEEIISIFPKGKFVSLFYLVIDTEKNDMVYTKASQESALMYKKDKNEIIELETEGQILGLFSKKLFGEIEFEEKKIDFSKDDTVILYTDGITEAVNKNGEFYGIDRLKENVKNSSLLDIENKLKDFLNGENMIDDLTLLKIKRIY